MDETAFSEKVSTKYWLHNEISKVANEILGLDNSNSIPEKGLKLKNSLIKKFDIMNLSEDISKNYEIIVAGELIEHLNNVSQFMKIIKTSCNNKTLICSTPNSTSVSQFLLALFKKESCHKDHLQIFSFKTLNTLCLRSGFQDWKILPYHVKFTEMIMNSKGFKRYIIIPFEEIINLLEYFFPLTSEGLILYIKKI